MNIIIAGPCGVGKSTIAFLLANKTGLKHLDFDEIRANKNSPPCSLSKINIIECLSNELNNTSIRFILDIGGGTIFSQTSNTDEQLCQILRLKKEFLARIILLKANKDDLFERYTISTIKKGVVSEKLNKDFFNMAWASWKKSEQPNWEKCSVMTIDTTHLTANDVLEKIFIYLESSD